MRGGISPAARPVWQAGKRGCKMERKESKEGRKEGESFYPCSRRLLFTALLASLPLSPPCSVPASTPPSILSATFIFHCFHPFSAKQQKRRPLFRSFQENFARETAPPHQFPPSSLNVTIPFPFVSGESNVVWRWHQLNGWPLHAHSAQRKA